MHLMGEVLQRQKHKVHCGELRIPLRSEPCVAGVVAEQVKVVLFADADEGDERGLPCQVRHERAHVLLRQHRPHPHALLLELVEKLSVAAFVEHRKRFVQIEQGGALAFEEVALRVVVLLHVREMGEVLSIEVVEHSEIALRIVEAHAAPLRAACLGAKPLLGQVGEWLGFREPPP